MQIFLSKTPQEKREQNPKLPYFRLVLPPKEEGGEWTEVGALWVTKSGKGYSGRLGEGWQLIKNDKTETTETTDPLSGIPF